MILRCVEKNGLMPGTVSAGGSGEIELEGAAAGYNLMPPLNTNLCPHLPLLDGAAGPAQATVESRQTSARRMLSGSGPGDVYQSVKFSSSKSTHAPRLRSGRGQELPQGQCKSAKLRPKKFKLPSSRPTAGVAADGHLTLIFLST